MNGMQFGRWIAERRRVLGWTSQHALVDALRSDPFLREEGISEDFIARLEAGQFVYPLRGRVRRRVLLLARMLCASPGDLRAYVRAADLGRLSPTEEEEIASLQAVLAPRTAPAPRLLPRRPVRLLGREAELAELVEALSSSEAELCSVTGMPGVGKSALAAEAMHALAADESIWARRFPDGAAAFHCAGRRGVAGLISLLDDIDAVFSGRPAAGRRASRTGGRPSPPDRSTGDLGNPDANTEQTLAGSLERARHLCGQTRALILLDDVDPHLPLDRALDALLAANAAPRQVRSPGWSRGGGTALLTTSRHIPFPRRRAHRLALGPLGPDAAYEFFRSLLEPAVAPEDTQAVQGICAALGYLPLAIELAVVAATVRRIPLAVLADHLWEHPLDRVLDSEGELRARIASAVAALDEPARRRFALLSALGRSTFSLGAATALDAPTGVDAIPHALTTPASALPALALPDAQEENGERLPGILPGILAASDVACAAADLGELVRHSLVEPISYASDDSPRSATGRCADDGAAETQTSCEVAASAQHIRYRIHPLVRAYADEEIATLPAGTGERAGRSVWEYAAAFAKQHRADRVQLERARDLLIPSLLASKEAGQLDRALMLAACVGAFAGRRGVDPDGEKALVAGARAAHELGDRHALVLLLFRLGLLHFYRGANTTARRIWEDALTFADGLDDLPYMRLPERGLGFLAAACGEPEESLRHASAYKQACLDDGDRFAAAGAMVSHAFQLRVTGRFEESYEDATACADIAVPADGGEATPHVHIVAVEAQIELARLSGEYEKTQVLIEECFALNRRYRDHYMAAECLAEQAEFAFGLGAREDARELAVRVEDLAATIGAPGLALRARALLAGA